MKNLPFVRVTHSVMVASLLTLPTFRCLAQNVFSDPPYSIVDRGPFYRVLQRNVSVTNSVTGEVTQQVQSYTDLEDGMNYLSSGQWVEAQDVIELTPTGAQAIHGQMTADFNSDITTVGAIRLATATESFQSHPIGLFYMDSASGKVAQIGAVQQSAGILYPPNIIVFSNVLSKVRADLMLVWAKNGFEQNLVLQQNPPPPSSFGLSSATTTLQFWTAMDSFPTPQQQRAVTLDSGLVDHILHFQSCWFPVGSAFTFGTVPLPAQGQAAQVRPIDPSTPGTVQVAKSLVNISGSTVLIEEVNYTDLLPVLSTLPQASLGPSGRRMVQLADRGQLLPPASVPQFVRNPMQLAAVPYSPKGVTLDYATLNGTASSFTFTNGTYLITNTFTVSPNLAAFSNSACIKFSTNAYLMLEGPVSFPSSGSPVVFTSKDDNAYGDPLPGSTANPGYAANPGVWMYYRSIPTTVQNALIRWAQEGMHYTEEVNANLHPALNSSVFQNCKTGVYLDIANDTLYLSGDTYCNVVTPIGINAGYVSGSMTRDCGVVSVAMVNDPNRDLYDYDTNKNSQSECSFAVLDSTNIVAAFMNTHLSEYGLGEVGELTPPSFPGIPSQRMTSWAVSRNNGASFMDNGPILPVSTFTNGSTIITNGAPDPTLGDAGDTCMAYDPNHGANGVVYLLLNPSRESGYSGFRLWASTNKGTSFILINTNVPGNVQGVDGPRLKLVGSDLYASGGFEAGGSITCRVWVAHSANGGASWNSFHTLETNFSNGGAEVLQAPGTIYAFWLQRGTTSAAPYTNVFSYAWLSGGSWSSSRSLGITLNSPNAGGSGNPLRFNGDNTNDFFISNGVPFPAFANGRVYLAYADLPSTNSTSDHGDIFLAEFTTNSDHSLSLSAIRKVNNDRTSTDQWNPAIAVNPAGTELFIGYYSRQNDPLTNSWITAYGAKAFVTNGLSQATFECIPISPKNFLPMFAGTNVPSNTWAYDPVWPQGGVCLDTNAMYAGTGDSSCTTCHWTNYPSCIGVVTFNNHVNFSADDYTWAAADSNYFYFAWCDRSRTFGLAPTNRPDADIQFAKIKQ